MYERKSVFTGIPLHKITSFKARCLEDSFSRNGNTSIKVHKVKLFIVSSDKEHVTAQANANAILFDKGDNHFYAGEIINVSGKLTENTSVNVSTNNVNNNVAYYGRVNKIHSEGFYSRIYYFRAQVRRFLEHHISLMGYPVSSLFMGFFLGVRDNIPEDMYEGFKQTGTLHLLALSGLHVGIIYLLFILIIKPLPGTWIKWILGSIFVVFYLFLIGPRPSLFRASLMLIIAGLCILLDRDFEPLNILGLALLILLLIDPASIFSLSFQLSFLALAGILIPGRAISRFLAAYIPGIIRLPFSYSLGAQIATVPLVLYSFGIYYPVGIFLTIIMIPLVTLFIWGGIIFLLLLIIPFSLLHTAVSIILTELYKIIFVINGFFSGFQGITFKWRTWYGYFPAAVVLAIYIITMRNNDKIMQAKIINAKSEKLFEL